MTGLLAGIMTKLSGSDLETDVGGRIYYDRAPDQTAFPYVIFQIVTGIQDDSFTDSIDEVTVQFSLYSTSRSLTEIGTMYSHLVSLFDNATFSITGDTLLLCQRRIFNPMVDEIVTSTGALDCKHWAVDYAMVVKD